MEQRQLGKDGPMVGAIGLGAMSFGGMYGPTSEAESHRTLDRCAELGVTHIDTANVYGEGVSETVVANYLRTRPNRFVVATKAGIKNKPVRTFDNSPDYLRECLEGSLQRLGVDHIALYYIHRRDHSVPIEDVVGTLVRFKEEGKIGAIGFSEISPWSLERASAVHPIAAVQSEYSLWVRQPDLGMIDACRRHGTAFVAFSPLGRGMFADRIPDPATFASTDFRAHNPRFQEPHFSRNAAAVGRFSDYARQRGHSTAALALAWVLHQGQHIIPIPGTRTSGHLTQDADAAAIRLTRQDIADIEAILPVGFAHGPRYSDAQAIAVESYC